MNNGSVNLLGNAAGDDLYIHAKVGLLKKVIFTHMLFGLKVEARV